MIYEKLYKMMEEVTYLQKDKENPHFHYSYVSDESVMEMFHKLLVKHKVVACPKYNLEQITPSEKGYLFVVSLALTLVDAEDPESSVTIETVGAGWDSADKGSGKAMTNASKYAVIKALALATGDDDPEADGKTDALTAGSGPGKPKAAAPEPEEFPKDLGNGFYAGVPIPNCTGHGKKTKVWDRAGDGRSFRFYCNEPKENQCNFVEYHK